LKPIHTDAYRLLRQIVSEKPFRWAVAGHFKNLDKHVGVLLRHGLLKVTGEGGQWERFFPTHSATLWLEWQAPLEAKRLEKLNGN